MTNETIMMEKLAAQLSQKQSALKLLTENPAGFSVALKFRHEKEPDFAVDLQDVDPSPEGPARLGEYGYSEGLSLRGQNLSGLYLAKVDFSGSGLDNTRFSGANLKGANFQGSYIADSVDFDGAELEGAHFLNATFESQEKVDALKAAGAKVISPQIIDNSEVIRASAEAGEKILHARRMVLVPDILAQLGVSGVSKEEAADGTGKLILRQEKGSQPNLAETIKAILREAGMKPIDIVLAAGHNVAGNEVRLSQEGQQALGDLVRLDDGQISALAKKLSADRSRDH